MNRSGQQIRKSDNQSKFIQDRITEVEKHFGDFCTNFAAFSRRLSKIRDKGDALAENVMSYAEHVSHNQTTTSALTKFAETLSSVQDYRDAEVKRIEERVITPLTQYGDACKHAKERLKIAFSTRDKEIRQKKNLDKVRDKHPSDRHQITQAQEDLHRASTDASRSSKALEEEMDRFEKKKLGDIKKILMEFVHIELLFHAKALEMYTLCHQSLDSLDEEEDLEEFRNSLRPPHAQTRMGMQSAISKTSLNSSMNTTGLSMGQASTTSSRHHTPVAVHKSPHNSRTNLANRSSSHTNMNRNTGMYTEDSRTTDSGQFGAGWVVKG